MLKGVVQFPDPHEADEDGLLCIGGDLDVATLYSAYRAGIFPWPQENLPLLWFSPPERGILDFSQMHWPRRFLQDLKKTRFEVSFDKAFADVIDGCASIPRTHEKGTWILPSMRAAYIKFFEAGYAHSVEAWHEGRLVGGLYGVFVEGVFSGESMFFREPNASKFCLYNLVSKLKENGVEWMDIQMVTPVLAAFGGKLISRDDYLERVRVAQASAVKLKF